MSTATVTSKGQITIPLAVREALGIEVGDQVVFVASDDGVLLHPVRRRPLSALHGAVAHRREYRGRAAERAAAQEEAARNAVGERSEP
jgi:antitoxin PrlF